MDVHLRLFSILREKLSPESKDQAVLRLDRGGSLQDLLDKFEISRKVVISMNGTHELDMSRRLQDSDRVKIFSSISGGQSVAIAKVHKKGERNG